MSVVKPEEMSRAFAAAFEARDIERLMALYELGVKYVLRSGQVVEGVAAVREVFQQAFALKANFEIENRYCVVNGDIALVRAEWRLHGTNAAGEPLDAKGRSAEVLRRQADGTWRYAIDNPHGAD